MKISAPFLTGLAVCFLLWETNPRDKKHYIDQAAQHVQAHCCQATSASSAGNCQWLYPFAQPIVKAVLHFYTDQPTNYYLFTKYTTRLPTRETLHGLGVAGQVFSWSHPAISMETTCGRIHDSLSIQLPQRLL
ncbi:MAG: DUF4359 domain-containing protein [Phormidesmis sp.]